MKNKLTFLVGEGLKRKINSKTFKIVNIILLIVLPLLINIDSIIKLVGGDFTKPTEVFVFDETEKVYDLFLSTYEQTGGITLSQTEIEFKKPTETLETISEKIKEEESKNIIINITKNDSNVFDAEIISYEEVDLMLHQNIINSLNGVKVNLALLSSDIDQEELNRIYSAVEVKETALNEDFDNMSSKIKSIGYTLIPLFIMPFFLIVIFVIQMIGAEINEEKTSKSMEIIISSVSPKTHFISKMITVNLFVILQLILMLIYGGIGLWIRTLVSGVGIVESFGIDINSILEMAKGSGLITEIVMSIPFIIILFILSIVAYSLLAGILASMTTSIEDFQQLQTPMMILILIGYYLAIMASAFDNATFLNIFSVVPFISALLAPVLLIMGQIGFIEIIVSVLLLVLVIFLFIRYGLRVYKVGILNYSTSKLWKKVFKAMKEKE